jgi:hypothetical protein
VFGGPANAPLLVTFALAMVVVLGVPYMVLRCVWRNFKLCAFMGCVGVACVYACYVVGLVTVGVLPFLVVGMLVAG